jgi:hypothetical protein
MLADLQVLIPSVLRLSHKFAHQVIVDTLSQEDDSGWTLPS